MGIRAVLWVMFRSPGTGIRSATIWILRGATACFARRLRQRTKPPAMPAAASRASSPLPRLIPAARAKSGRRRARPRAADPDPCGPVHHRVSGNREAIWRNTDRLAGEDRALGEDTVIGHGIFLNDHPFLHYPHVDDFSLLRDSGAQVAHCPVVFARRGIAMNTLDRYRKAGIRCGIGTDTFPHNNPLSSTWCGPDHRQE